MNFDICQVLHVRVWVCACVQVSVVVHAAMCESILTFVLFLLSSNSLLFFISFFTGEYDALLPWPFQLRVTMMLMDQTDHIPSRRNITEVFKPDHLSASFKKPTSEMNTGQSFFVLLHFKQSLTHLPEHLSLLSISIKFY